MQGGRASLFLSRSLFLSQILTLSLPPSLPLSLSRFLALSLSRSLALSLSRSLAFSLSRSSVRSFTTLGEKNGGDREEDSQDGVEVVPRARGGGAREGDHCRGYHLLFL